MDEGEVGTVLHVGIAGARRGSGIPLLSHGDRDAGDRLRRRRRADRPRTRACSRPPGAPCRRRSRCRSARAHASAARAAWRSRPWRDTPSSRRPSTRACPRSSCASISNEIEEPDRALWRFDDAFAELARVTRARDRGARALVKSRLRVTRPAPTTRSRSTRWCTGASRRPSRPRRPCTTSSSSTRSRARAATSSRSSRSVRSRDLRDRYTMLRIGRRPRARLRAAGRRARAGDARAGRLGPLRHSRLGHDRLPAAAAGGAPRSVRSSRCATTASSRPSPRARSTPA